MKLVYNSSTDATSLFSEWAPTLVSDHILPQLTKYFEIEAWDPNKHYDRASTIFLAHSHIPKTEIPEDRWYVDYLRSGYKVVIENVFESIEFYQHNIETTGLAMILHCPDYFWFNEYCVNKFDNNDRYSPSRNFKKLALLPIRADRLQRREVLVRMSPYLDDMYWSYGFFGRRLPEDNDEFFNDRAFNKIWYDDTSISIVVETSVKQLDPVFITEKTYKPIACFHPFMVMGCPGTLEHLRKLGFETYDNLWDEKYDQEPNWEIRADLITKNLRQFKHEIWPKWKNDQQMDAETLRRVNHNHNLFYNESVVDQLFFNDIVKPLLEYAGRD